MALKLHVVNRSFCFFLFLFLAALSYVLPCCNISDHRNIVGHCHGVVCILCLPLGGLSSMSAFWACYEIMLQCRPRVSGLPASYSLVVLYHSNEDTSATPDLVILLSFTLFFYLEACSQGKKKKILVTGYPVSSIMQNCILNSLDYNFHLDQLQVPSMQS